MSGQRSSGKGDIQASVFTAATETSSFNTHVTYTAITLLLAVECLCVPVPMLLSVRVIVNATVPTLHALEGLLSSWWCCIWKAQLGTLKWEFMDVQVHKRHSLPPKNNAVHGYLDEQRHSRPATFSVKAF